MSQEQVFSDWKEREALAEAMIPLIGKVYRENNVEVSVFGRSVVNRSVISILKSHRAARMLEHTKLSVHETFPVVEVLQALPLSMLSAGKCGPDHFFALRNSFGKRVW